jgi:hypothetical protein
MEMGLKKIFLVAVGVFILLPAGVWGQTAASQPIITWRANNYFPASYVGKASATPGSQVTASVESIANGKIQDTTNANISWYLDGKWLGNGVGLKTVSFTASGQNQGYETLNVSVSGSGGAAEGSIRIPVANPEISISFPYPQKSVKAGDQVTLSAIPYFFNITSFEDLGFNWRINNQKVQATANNITVTIGTPQSDFQNSVQISVTVQNVKNPMEIAKKLLILPIIQ